MVIEMLSTDVFRGIFGSKHNRFDKLSSYILILSRLTNNKEYQIPFITGNDWSLKRCLQDAKYTTWFLMLRRYRRKQPGLFSCYVIGDTRLRNRKLQ